MVKSPRPCVAGLNVTVSVPSMAYVPPAGLPPIRVKAASEEHTVPKGSNATIGNVFTVTTKVLAVLSPQLFSAVTLIVPEALFAVAFIWLEVLVPIHPLGSVQL